MATDYRQSAADYALREIAGTDLIAFRKIAARVAQLGLKGRALDVGCGAGRSTRFLKSLGFDADGADINEAMVREARKRDAAGTYRLCDAYKPLPATDNSFDVVLAMWVVLEIETRAELERFFAEIARVLRPRGVAFIVANTSGFYSGKWLSCEVDFPENRAPLRSGRRVLARLMPEGVVVKDIFRGDEDYRRALDSAGFTDIHGWTPLAPASEPGWRDETRVAPWIVYEAACEVREP